MYLRTLSWSSVSSKTNIHIDPIIQIFCKDLNNNSVYVKLKANSTIIIEFENDIIEDDLIDIYESYQPISAYASLISNKCIAMRNPKFKNYQNLKKEIIGFEQDPDGLLSSFWKARNITPYQWIYIEKYEYLNKKNTYCDIEIKTSEEFIYNVSNDLQKFPIISTNKLFFDIEVISPDRNFTDAKILTHEIFMISVITEINNKSKSYILTTKNTNFFSEANFEKYDTEKDLIIGFFDLWREVNPDRCINYNGDSYDMPYILDRAKLHKISIPSLSKLISSSIITTVLHQSPIGIERVKSIISPGTEKLDLVKYFRKFYPGNENYKLETIGKLYLGEGKSGLEIEEMFKIVESNDPEKMKIVSWYSYKDSILLYDLWKKMDIEIKIENICNDIYCTSEELLRLSDKELITRMFHHTDIGTIMLGKINIDNISYLKSFKQGVYKNVYVNKYDELFDIALNMNTTNSDYLDIIIDNIKYLPSYMKAIIIYSNYVPLDIRNYFEELINNIRDVIAIDNNFIYTKIHDIKNLSLVNVYDYLFVISQSSIIYYKNDIFIRIGLHNITRPKYEYIKMIVDSYLLDYIAGKKVTNRKITIQDLSKIDKNLFVVKTKIKPLSSYKDKRLIKYKISQSLSDIEIKTWINVKYVYIINGFKIINDNIDENLVLDYKKYMKDINDLYKTLDMMIK